jgi:CxxC motif-containing protein (DUF1111 family)
MMRRIETSRDRCVRERRSVLRGFALWVGCLGGTVTLAAGAFAWAADREPQDRKAVAQGRELFEREWIPGDARSHGGDGLGPVYNDSSCVACHNLGGTGGGGASSKNVDIISASPNGQLPPVSSFDSGNGNKPTFLGKALGSLIGMSSPSETRPKGTTPAAPLPTAKPASTRSGAAKIDTSPLVKKHPGFKTSRSVVLHRFGTGDEYESWRQSLLGLENFAPRGRSAQMEMLRTQNSVSFDNVQMQMPNNVGQFALVRSQRNPTALFGTGLIDAIPEAAIEAGARAKHPGFPEIAGRVSRLKDKRLGRFGWKAQTASLPDFVLTACAVELGLEVPAHHQGGSPQKPEDRATGLDLTTDECNALVSYVRDLPKPAERKPATDQESTEIAAGRQLFAAMGCATCHTPKLGEVDGLYSDLLVHDMGAPLGDTGQYGVFDPSSSDEEVVDDPGPIANGAAAPGTIDVVVDSTVAPVPPAAPMFAQAMIGGFLGGGATATGKRPTTGPASRFEWRTPPLWGFRDSGPYLHDGRAETLDQAVSLHGGESARIALDYFNKSAGDRRRVEAFLKSLVAPVPRNELASAAR